MISSLTCQEGYDKYEYNKCMAWGLLGVVFNYDENAGLNVFNSKINLFAKKLSKLLLGLWYISWEVVMLVAHLVNTGSAAVIMRA